MFQFLKNDKSLKKDIRLIFLIAIGACFAIFLLSLVAGCASQSSREDSNHYVAVAQQPQGYPCPSCGHQIPMENISANIRTENKCPNCGKIFFGVPVIVIESKDETEFQDKPHQGPKVFDRGYYSDIKYGNKFDHSVKNTWKVSPDGSSGSMSQTFIRTYEHTTKGEHGTMVGPAGLGRYGGY